MTRMDFAVAWLALFVALLILAVAVNRRPFRDRGEEPDAPPSPHRDRRDGPSPIPEYEPEVAAALGMAGNA